MFSLVSRKFLAMRNITLYSVCIANTKKLKIEVSLIFSGTTTALSQQIWLPRKDNRTMHRGAFGQLLFGWIYYCHSRHKIHRKGNWQNAPLCNVLYQSMEEAIGYGMLYVGQTDILVPWLKTLKLLITTFQKNCQRRGNNFKLYWINE